MVRIISGRSRGRRLKVYQSGQVRPTSDKVRQALFNLLTHRFDRPVYGAHVLDLFSGSGSLGLEALSRGAAHCTFVEREHNAVALLRENCQATQSGEQSTILTGDVFEHLRLWQGHDSPSPFDLIFIDPPYQEDLGVKILTHLDRGGAQLLTREVILILESDLRRPQPRLESWPLALERRYGNTLLSFFYWQGASSHLPSSTTDNERTAHP